MIINEPHNPPDGFIDFKLSDNWQVGFLFRCVFSEDQGKGAATMLRNFPDQTAIVDGIWLALSPCWIPNLTIRPNQHWIDAYRASYSEYPDRDVRCFLSAGHYERASYASQPDI